MAYKDKVRVNIALDKDVNDRLIEMSKRMGMSKTNLCAMMILQQIDTFEKTYELLKNPSLMQKLIDETYESMSDTISAFSNLNQALNNNGNDESK